LQYRKFGKVDFESSLLGFGTMRLPMRSEKRSDVDEEKAIELLRYAINHGVNYIDTAYTYHDGMSEVVVGKALKDGYREKVMVVDKLPIWLVNTYDDFNKLLDEQLKRLDVDCIDILLLHALNKKIWHRAKDMGVLEFYDRAIEEGKIKYSGFSIHDDFETFKEIIDSYKWTMCLIQQNYLDAHEQVQVKGLRYAGEKDIAVGIMEPLKGGILANPPKDIQWLWDTAEKKKSPVEWSFSWLASFPEVKVILSGMNELEQIKENIEIMSRCTENALNEDEIHLIEKVKEKYIEKIKVNCTKCQYCMPCPMGVDIPKNFTYYNNAYMFEDLNNVAHSYQTGIPRRAKASNCKGCKECEKKCPQGIKISEVLKDVDEMLSSVNDFSGKQWRVIY
jgi:predicted aldo/keto reductase-like oxidoreductase